MKPPAQNQNWDAVAGAAMQLEADAILAAASRLNGSFSRAVELILEQPGKVVVTGIGKSGHIARKIVATLCSTGTPAVFVHPAEAPHGDLGVCSPGDVALMISKSGTTAELLRLAPILRGLGSKIVGILGNTASPLAAEMDVVLDASVRREADPHNVAPTVSAIVALALGHALAVALMQARKFTLEDFSRYHPAGQLGRNLSLKVRQAMHSGDRVARVAAQQSLKQVAIAMTSCPLGAACVVAPDGKLEGLITDGDLRRALQSYDDIRPLRAADVMTASPITVPPDALLVDALRLMEDRPSQVSVLPVVDPSTGGCLGLIRLHDIYRAG